MKEYEDKLKRFIDDNELFAELMIFQSLVDHKENVLEAIKDMNIDFDDIVKTVVFIDQDKAVEEGNGIVAIVPANSRVNKQRLKELTNSRLKIAGGDEVLKLTGYPAGGVPVFGYRARFFMDNSLKDKEGIIYTGGGSLYALIKTKISEILKASNPFIEKIIE